MCLSYRLIYFLNFYRLLILIILIILYGIKEYIYIYIWKLYFHTVSCYFRTIGLEITKMGVKFYTNFCYFHTTGAEITICDVKKTPACVCIYIYIYKRNVRIEIFRSNEQLNQNEHRNGIDNIAYNATFWLEIHNIFYKPQYLELGEFLMASLF